MQIEGEARTVEEALDVLRYDKYQQCNYNPPSTKLKGGILVSPGPSVRPSMWTESCPLCIFNNTHWIHFIFAHFIKQLQKVLHVKFLAATKQLYKWYFPSVRPSVRPSVCPSHLLDYVPIIVSSWNFQELLPMTKVRSMQKVKVRGQRSRSQRSQPNLTVSGL